MIEKHVPPVTKYPALQSVHPTADEQLAQFGRVVEGYPTILKATVPDSTEAVYVIPSTFASVTPSAYQISGFTQLGFDTDVHIQAKPEAVGEEKRVR